MLDLQSILAIASAIVVSVGGSGAIICATSKFLSERIAKRLDSAYQQKLNEQLEKYKLELDNKRYMTKEQFDVQMQIYRDLSKSYFQILVKLCSISEEDFYKDTGSDFDKKRFEEYTYRNIVTTISIAQNVLYENAPFIPKHIFQKYDELYGLINNQFWSYNSKYYEYVNGKIKQEERLTESDKNIYKEVERKLFEVSEDVRIYLESLTLV